MSVASRPAVGGRPAPEGWPAEAYATDPFPFWQLLRDEHPVWWSDATNTWHLTRYDDVAGVFGDSERWSNRFYAKRSRSYGA